MELSALRDPFFIAKAIDFTVFVVALAWLYKTRLEPMLVAFQESQNKTVEDAQASVARGQAAVAAATQAIQQAKADAARMTELGKAQAQRLVVDERAAANEHARRILDHANGELERERYRVRRELLEETVEQATARARTIVTSDLTPTRQRELVEAVLRGLEVRHA